MAGMNPREEAVREVEAATAALAEAEERHRLAVRDAVRKGASITLVAKTANRSREWVYQLKRS